MNDLKTLTLAAVTALSLGAGSAMAQEGGDPSMPTFDYWATKTIATNPATQTNQVPAGSSGTDMRGGFRCTLTMAISQTRLNPETSSGSDSSIGEAYAKRPVLAPAFSPLLSRNGNNISAT